MKINKLFLILVSLATLPTYATNNDKAYTEQDCSSKIAQETESVKNLIEINSKLNSLMIETDWVPQDYVTEVYLKNSALVDIFESNLEARKLAQSRSDFNFCAKDKVYSDSKYLTIAQAASIANISNIKEVSMKQNCELNKVDCYSKYLELEKKSMELLVSQH